MGGAEKKKLWQRSDLRAEDIQVVRRARPREHRDTSAGGDPIVEPEVRAGAKVEAGEEMIGAEKNRAQVKRRGILRKPGRALAVHFHRVYQRVVFRRREPGRIGSNRNAALVVNR